MNAVWRFWGGEEAATSVEYAVVLALILMVLFASVQSVGSTTSSVWQGIHQSTQAAGLGS